HVDAPHLAGVEASVAGANESGEIEAERMADENARVEIGRVDPGVSQAPRDVAARRIDAEICRRPPRDRERPALPLTTLPRMRERIVRGLRVRRPWFQGSEDRFAHVRAPISGGSSIASSEAW